MLKMSSKPALQWNIVDAVERQRLVLENLTEVRYIARRIHERLPSHVLFSDLVQAGILGLIDAVDKFDPQKNVQFMSYARFRIRGAILDSLRLMDWAPRNLRRQAHRLEQASCELLGELGHSPSASESSFPGRDQFQPFAEFLQRQAAVLDRHPAVVADIVQRLAHGRPVDAAVARMDELAAVAVGVQLEVLDVALRRSACPAP